MGETVGIEACSWGKIEACDGADARQVSDWRHHQICNEPSNLDLMAHTRGAALNKAPPSTNGSSVFAHVKLVFVCVFPDGIALQTCRAEPSPRENPSNSQL